MGDPDTADADGETPLHIAAWRYRPNEEWLDIAGRLIDAGADGKATSHMAYRWSMLHFITRGQGTMPKEEQP